MREICTSGSVGGEDGDILTYPAIRHQGASHTLPLPKLDLLVR